MSSNFCAVLRLHANTGRSLPAAVDIFIQHDDLIGFLHCDEASFGSVAADLSRDIPSVAEDAFATALKTTIRACWTMESNKAPVSRRMSAFLRPGPTASLILSKLAVDGGR